MNPSHNPNLDDRSGTRRVCLNLNKVVRAACSFFCLLLGFSILASAQDLGDAPSNVLRHPGWSYGGQFSGGSTVVQVSAPIFFTANRSISNLAVGFHVGRVLTREHGPGWARGTFEWDMTVIPAEVFWVMGSHYAGGFEAFGPRWNFTGAHRSVVPFLGLSGGMLFSPSNFPPGDTAQFNFTAAFDAGTRLFLRPRRSLDLGMRIQHISNAFLGHSNPGVPVSLQLTLGYSWYRVRRK